MFNDAGRFFPVPNLPYAYMHWKCGGPAFMSDHLPSDGERLTAETIYHLDGNQALEHEIATCGTCGEPVWDLTHGPQAEDFKKVNGGTI